MKTVSLFIVALGLVGSVAFAKRGGVSDGGGQGVVCRNDQGEVTKALVLDLFEAENYFLLELEKHAEDKGYLEIAKEYAAILDQAMPSIDPTSEWSKSSGGVLLSSGFEINSYILHSHSTGYQPVVDELVRLDKKKKLIPNNVAIPPTKDSNPRVFPAEKGCHIEQIAVYNNDRSEVRFVGPVWNKLSNVHKAGLLVHEALYKRLRDLGDKDSDRTRKTVGYVFSGLKMKWIVDGILDRTHLMCWSEDDKGNAFKFVVFPESQNQHGVHALFLKYDGDVMLTQTYAWLPLAPFAKRLGLTVPPSSADGNVLFNDIENPLLDRPTFAFSYGTDSLTQKPYAKFEAVSGPAGPHGKSIVCNPHLTKITPVEGGHNYSHPSVP